MICLYRILTILAWPLILLYIYYRKYSGKEDHLRLDERFGYSSRVRPTGKIIWLHAVSVGELISIIPLIDGLRLKYPNATLLVTTVTINAAKIFESKITVSDQIIHQYLPVDDIFSVKRFLAHWRPDLFLPIESEIWPNLLLSSKKYCPIILINARMSGRSFANWSKCGKSATRKLFGYFDHIMAQSLTDQQHLVNLSAREIEFVGNLKYSAEALSADPVKLQELSAQIDTRPVLLAVSTHAGEEELITKAYLTLKKNVAGLLLIIAPRHTTRTPSIVEDLQQHKLNIAIRSKQQSITASTDLYLADTLGELGILYRIAKIAIIGGSLIPIGGHNPIEAIKLGCFAVMGPHTQNFTEVCADLAEKKMLLKTSLDQLADNLQIALGNQTQDNNDQLLEKMNNTGQQILRDILARIDQYMMGR